MVPQRVGNLHFRDFFLFHERGGKNMVSLKSIKEELMDKIDNTSPSEVEKVERYCDFIKTLWELNRILKEEGLITVTKNGAQEFKKAHPAIAEIKNINAQLLNIEKSFVFIDKTDEELEVGLI